MHRDAPVRGYAGRCRFYIGRRRCLYIYQINMPSHGWNRRLLCARASWSYNMFAFIQIIHFLNFFDIFKILVYKIIATRWQFFPTWLSNHLYLFLTIWSIWKLRYSLLIIFLKNTSETVICDCKFLIINGYLIFNKHSLI